MLTILSIASNDTTVKLWRRDGDLLKSLAGNDQGFINVSFSPDGKTLTASDEDKVKLWKSDGTLLFSLKGQKNKLTSVNFSPDGKMLVSGTMNGSVILRNWEDITLEKLITQGCDLLGDYLSSNYQVRQSDRHLCSQR